MANNSNTTSAENDKFARIIEEANRISYGVVSPIIITVGLAGNLATLVTLADTRKFSGRIYAYLRALAVSDLITSYLKDEHKERRTLGGASIQNQSSTTQTNNVAFPDHIKRVLDLYKNF